MAPLDSALTDASRSSAPHFRVEVRRVKGIHRYLVVGRTGDIKRICGQMETARMCADAYDRAARKALRRQERACLCCGIAFESHGPHNRLCDCCRQTAGGRVVLTRPPIKIYRHEKYGYSGTAHRPDRGEG